MKAHTPCEVNVCLVFTLEQVDPDGQRGKEGCQIGEETETINWRLSSKWMLIML